MARNTNEHILIFFSVEWCLAFLGLSFWNSYALQVSEVWLQNKTAYI